MKLKVKTSNIYNIRLYKQNKRHQIARQNKLQVFMKYYNNIQQQLLIDCNNNCQDTSKVRQTKLRITKEQPILFDRHQQEVNNRIILSVRQGKLAIYKYYFENNK